MRNYQNLVKFEIIVFKKAPLEVAPPSPLKFMKINVLSKFKPFFCVLKFSCFDLENIINNLRVIHQFNEHKISVHKSK